MTASYELSVAQISAGRILWQAIREAVDAGNTIPCTVDPEMWDDPDAVDESVCQSCPVIARCLRYRQAGVLTHPTVLAGRRINSNRSNLSPEAAA